MALATEEEGNVDGIFYIGGHPTLSKAVDGSSFPTSGMNHRSFVGRLGEFHINGRLMDPRRAAFVGDAVGGYGIGTWASCCTHVYLIQSYCNLFATKN